MISASAKAKKNLSNTHVHHKAPQHNTLPNSYHTEPHHIMAHHLYDKANTEGSAFGRMIYFVLGAFAVIGFVLAILAIGGYINYNDVPVSAIDGRLVENSSGTDNATSIIYDQDFEISTKSTSADLLIENNGNRINMGTDLQIASDSVNSQITVTSGGVFIDSILDMKGQNIVDVNILEVEAIEAKFLGNLTSTILNADTFTLNKISIPPTDVGTVGDVRLMLTDGSATFTGVIASGVLTASATTGTIVLGMTITGTGVIPNTIITSFGTGTGGNGTYNLNLNYDVSSTSMTGISTNRLYVNSASNVWNYLPLYTDGVGPNVITGSKAIDGTATVSTDLLLGNQPANTIIENFYITPRSTITTAGGATEELILIVGTSAGDSSIISASSILPTGTAVTCTANIPLPLIEDTLPATAHGGARPLDKYDGTNPIANGAVALAGTQSSSLFTSSQRAIYIRFTIGTPAITINIVDAKMTFKSIL